MLVEKIIIATSICMILGAIFLGPKHVGHCKTTQQDSIYYTVCIQDSLITNQ
jgi:hypothetical protein